MVDRRTHQAQPVRRNLFNQQLSRRPTSTSNSTSTSAETLRLDQDVENPLQASQSSQSLLQTQSSYHTAMQSQTQSSEIVRRDHNGDYELGDPSIALGIELGRGVRERGRGGEEEDELDDEDMEGMDASELRLEEAEKERRRLVEAVKLHQRDRNRAPSEPAELLEAVRASLRGKVNALADDNWMFEKEEEPLVR